MPLLTKCWALLVVEAFAAATALSQSSTGRTSSEYFPASYYAMQSEPQQLLVFPPVGGRIVIPLPTSSLPRSVAYFPDGRAIFATIDTIISPATASGQPARLGSPRLIRIDLSPVRVTTVADLVGVDGVLQMVVTRRQDRILFTGGGWKTNLAFNLYEIEPSGGDFKVLIPRFGGAVGDMSPDGTKILVPQVDDMAVVNIATGASVPLGGGLWKGAWSPDGRWIAALQLDPESEQPRPRLSRTILIDAHDFSQRRDLPSPA